MKRLLLMCLMMLLLPVLGKAQFSLDTEAYERQKREIEQEQRVQDSIKRLQIEELQIRANDIRYRIKWVNWLTYRQSVGFIESSHNISYYGYFQTKQKWTLPISLRLSSSTRYNENALRDGYNPDSWKKYLLDLGMSGFRNLKDDFYLAMGVQLPMGWERYRYDHETTQDRKHTHLLLGVGVEERVFYMSPNKTGLILGIGFYQRLMSSKLYTVDAGMTVEVGLKF